MVTTHRHELVTLDGQQGKLAGTLHIPEGTPRGAVLLAHCFTCSRSLRTTRHLASGIEDGGYAVLRFDFTGLGDSEGEFVGTTVTTNMEDLVAAASYLASRDFGPLAMVGHSLGGAATLLAAGAVSAARAVATLAAPFGPTHVRHLFAEPDVERVLASGHATVRIAGRPFDISRAFFDDLERHCTPDRVADLGRPLLVVHGTADTVVDITEGERIHAAARQPKWFAAVPGAEHLFTAPGAVEHVTAIVRTFLDAFVRAG